MNFDDDLKDLINETDANKRSEADAQRAKQKIITKAKRQQGQKDLLDFGFVKIWTILLELFSIIFVNVKKVQMETERVNKGDQDES